MVSSTASNPLGTLAIALKWLHPGGYHQHRCIVRSYANHNQTGRPISVRLQAPDHLRPITEVEGAGKQKIASARKEVPRHRQHEEVAGSGL